MAVWPVALLAVLPAVLVSDLIASTNQFLAISCATALALLCVNYSHRFSELDVLTLSSWIVVGALMFFATAVLFGAPLIQGALSTFGWGVFMTLHTGLPFLFKRGSDAKGVLELFCGSSPSTVEDFDIFAPGVACVCTAWLGALPIPLDWDRPWQAWPITCFVGAVAGHTLGVVVVWVAQLFGRKR